MVIRTTDQSPRTGGIWKQTWILIRSWKHLEVKSDVCDNLSSIIVMRLTLMVMMMVMMMRTMRMMRMTWMWWDMLDITNLTLERGLWNVDLYSNSPFVQCILFCHPILVLLCQQNLAQIPRDHSQQTGRWCIMSPAILGSNQPYLQSPIRKGNAWKRAFLKIRCSFQTFWLWRRCCHWLLNARACQSICHNQCDFQRIFAKSRRIYRSRI